MERWLFLQDEPLEQLKKFAYGLTDKLGDYWSFSEFRSFQIARVNLENFSLDKCFKKERDLERTAKLVIGQKFNTFERPKEKIRLAFRYGDIWSDFIAPQTNENYEKTNEVFKTIFKTIFKTKMEDYQYQQQI